MADRLLFLLIGILIKQTIDEIKTLTKQRIEDLKKQREATASYKPLPALLKDSPEAHRAILKAQHADHVRPEVEKLTRRINRTRYIPVILYVILTIGLIVFATFITSSVK